MVSWQVTATTIHCKAVDDEVTLMVYKDGTAKCTGFRKYGQPTRETLSRLKKRQKQLHRNLACQGAECDRVIQYRDKLFKEEAEKNPLFELMKEHQQ